MASFSRSFKSPSFLSPVRRPGMPGRSISNSSSLADVPASPQPQSPSYEPSEFSFSVPGSPVPRSSTEMGHPEDSEKTTSTPRGSPRTSSQPINIALPRAKNFYTTSSEAWTPTEPLSARGDLKGGYFPRHEDPNARVNRTHPFHHEPKPLISKRTASETVQSDGTQRPSESPAPVASAPPQYSASPRVGSYLPGGLHDQSVPLGKYYPSNYEARKKTPAEDSQFLAPSSMPSSFRPDSSRTLGSSSKTSNNSNDSEVKRKLLQYQRDMVAQAKMAASEILKSSKDASKLPSSATQRTKTLNDFRLTASTPHKPVSPRLMPLGSPGPVTPMDLAESGSYLERVTRPDNVTAEDRLDLGAGYTSRTL